MTLNRADPRFVLPFPPRNAVVLGSLDDWAHGLRRAGIDVLDRPRAGVDLVVAPRGLERTAVELRPRGVVIDGDAPRPLEQAGLTARRLMARPDRREPALLLPLDQPAPCVYAIDAWSVVDTHWKRLRRAVARNVVPSGLVRRLPQVLTVGAGTDAPPYLVAAAHDHGVPLDAGWVLTLGRGDALSRNAFQLFRPASTVPAWVLKFSRVRGDRTPFDRDERGLAVAARAGRVVGDRAPRLVARFDVAGAEASLETAAVGKRLREILLAPGRRARKLELIDSVAAWIVEVGQATRRPSSVLAEELERIRRDVIPRYGSFGVSEELVRRVADIPSVLQHNDLGSWNVVADGADFVVVDWESTRQHGLPLWDTAYFLADALALLDGAADGGTRHEHTRRLFRGELASSPILFRWIRSSVESLELPNDAVGPIVALCWMHHAQSPVERGVRLERFADDVVDKAHGTELNAEAWLSDPALGVEWPAWQGR